MAGPRDRRRPMDGKKDEAKEEPGPLKGPSPIIIIAAAAIVLLIIIAAVYMIASSGSRVGSLAVGNIEKGVDGISFDLMATPSGLGEYSGEVTVEISYPGLDEPLFTDRVRINDGWGLKEVDYNEFIWGNGEYTVTVRGDGKEANNTFMIRNVVTGLDIQWQGLNSDETRNAPEFQVEVNITYMFGITNRPLSSLPQGYDLTATVERPAGSDVSILSSDFSPSLIKLQKRIDHTMVGTYTISGSLVNTFCHPDSPFRTVAIEENDTFHFDAHPFAVAGDDITISMSGGGGDANFDGSGSWDDGDIVEYSWDFGDGEASKTSQPTVSHTYAQEGTYFVELVVKDGSGRTSENQGGTSSSLKVTVTA